MTIETIEIKIASAPITVLDWIVGTLEKTQDLWRLNDLQFPRLLAEINATQELDIPALEASMDLSADEIYEIFDRADTAWNGFKERSWSPSTNPAQSWLIIEREKINFDTDGHEWQATVNAPVSSELNFISGCGPTSLIAAMRCYAISKLGATAKVPASLLIA